MKITIKQGDVMAIEEPEEPKVCKLGEYQEFQRVRKKLIKKYHVEKLSDLNEQNMCKKDQEKLAKITKIQRGCGYEG
jgi:hypothetical protein